MSDDRPEWARRLLDARLNRGWRPADVLRRLRETAHDVGRENELAAPENLRRYLRDWERGQHRPDVFNTWLLRQVYGTGGNWPFEAVPALPPPATPDRLARVVAQPARLDGGTLDALATMLDGARRLDDSIGSAAVRRPVREQLSVVAELVRQARGTWRPRLVDLAAQWAQFSGWLHISTGELDVAYGWLDRASEWAAEADNREMAAAALSYKGHIAWLRGEPGAVVGLSRAAQREQGIHVGQLAYDAGQEARGHALIGDRKAADRKLGEAADRAAEAAECADDMPPWDYYRTPGFFRLERGLACHILGEHRAAVELLTAGMDELQPADWLCQYQEALAGSVARV